MGNVLAKIVMMLGIAATVLPALAPLVHLDPGGVTTLISALGSVVAAVGGLYHAVPGSPPKA